MTDRSVVVRLVADTTQYGSRMRGAARDTRQLGAAGAYTEKKLGDLKRVAATFAVAGVVKAGIDFDALKQRSQAAFTTMTGSAATAKKELHDLYAEFKNNPFGYPQIVKSAQMLQAMGVNGREVIPTIKGISDAVASVGGNAEVFDRVSLAIGQMQAKGTIQAEEIRQLAEAGIPAWQLLAHEIGVSVPEAMKLSEKRMITSDIGVKALIAGIEQKFGGATDNLKNTWTGTLTQFKTEAIQAGGEIAKPIMRIATDGMHALRPLLAGIGDVATGFSNLPNPIQNTAFALGAVMLLSGRLNAAWSGLRASGRGFRDEMALQTRLAAMQGQTIGRFGAIAAATSIRVQGLGRSLVGAFGGPIGIGITAITLGLSLYSQHQAEAAQRAAQHKAEVDELSAALDKNTLSLTANGRASQVDAFLAGRGKDGMSASLVDELTKAKIDPQLARRAILGDADAMRQLTAAMEHFKQSNPYDATVIFSQIQNKASEMKDAIRQTADTMRLAIPDAAKKVGVSADSISHALDIVQAHGGDLNKELQNNNLTAKQAAAVFDILAGSLDNAAGGMYQLGNASAQARKDIAAAAGQFTSVSGAWDSAVSLKTAAAGGAGKTPSASDDPAYKAAKKAYDTQYAILRRLKSIDKDRLAPLKALAKADAEAAAAATKRATALRKLAADAKSAYLTAKDAKDAADERAHDAAALAAAIKDESGRAGTADAGAWAAAQVKANAAAAEAARQQVAANADASAKQKTAVSTGSAAKQATDEAKALQAKAKESKAAAQGLADELDRIERVAERRHERLLAAKNRAEQRAQARTEAYTNSVGGAYGSMADKVQISLNEYLTELQHQVTAQRNWKNNLITLAAKVPPGIAEQLAKLGPQAAPLVDKLVHGTDGQLKRFVRLFGQAGTDAATRVAGALTDALPLLSAVAQSAGTDVAAKLAAAISNGETTVKRAYAALGASLDSKTLKVNFGIKNPKDIASVLDNLIRHTIYLIKPTKTTVHGEPGFRVTGTTTVFGFNKGGWIRGGSGARDDVPLPSKIPNYQPVARGGEFMVRKDIAQANKAFFDQLDRTGRMPASAPHVIVMQQPAPSGPRVVNQFAPGSIVQQPGQSAHDLLREIDRLADIGMGP